MSDIESNYNYQVTTGGRGYGKTFFENRIRQAYKSGIDVGFIGKHKLIKYLEEEYRLNNEEWKDAKSRDDEMFYFGKLKAISSILEKVKSDKYE